VENKLIKMNLKMSDRGMLPKSPPRLSIGVGSPPAIKRNNSFMIPMTPKVVGSKNANIDGIYVPPDKKEKKKIMNFILPKKKEFVSQTRECSPTHYVPILDTSVH